MAQVVYFYGYASLFLFHFASQHLYDRIVFEVGQMSHSVMRSIGFANVSHTQFKLESINVSVILTF